MFVIVKNWVVTRWMINIVHLKHTLSLTFWIKGFFFFIFLTRIKNRNGKTVRNYFNKTKQINKAYYCG